MTQWDLTRAFEDVVRTARVTVLHDRMHPTGRFRRVTSRTLAANPMRLVRWSRIAEGNRVD